MGQRCPACLGGARRNIRRPRREAGLPPATVVLLVITSAVYLLSWLFPELENRLVREWAMVGGLSELGIGVAAGQWWRMITAVLLHVSMFHILFNMWALYAFGPQIEKESGSLPFLAVYLSGAAGGSLFIYWFSDPFTLAVGASGSIFGLFGVWVAGAYRLRHTRFGRRVLAQLGILLGINIVLPLFIPNIAWQAHLGGLATGMVIGFLWSVQRRGGRRGWWLTASALTVGVMAVVAALVMDGGLPG